MWQINHYPKDNPYNYFKQMNKKSNQQLNKKRIVFVGDSLTHGNLSVNYINILATKLGTENFDYINAGMNSELAYNVNNRIESVIAIKPDFITILIGTNDAHRELGLFDDKESEKRLALPQKASKEWFQENLEEVISKLQKNSNAKIALCSIPPLGEDPIKEAYQQTITFTKIIKKIASKYEIGYLPVNEIMIEFLKDNPSEPKYPIEHRIIEEVAMKHFLLGKNFDTISEEYGFSLLTDNIHLNTKGAEIIANLIEEFIKN